MTTLTALVSIVLVHGASVDGSGWEDVYQILKRDGYEVSVVQIPTISLATDVTLTKQAGADQSRPVLLVGHSYGGTVITEAGNDPQVVGLVYIAGLVPDAGESVESLIKDPPPGAVGPPILPPQDGFLFLDKQKFAQSFAADLPAEKAAFMANSQVPLGVQTLSDKVSKPAWKSKPSWYLVTTQDRMIPPAAQHAMAARAGAVVSETPASHAVYLSKPKEVAAFIAKAAREAAAKGR